MVGGLRIIRVQAGREAEFERLFNQLAATTHERERGCVVYILMRSRSAQGSYVVHEEYADQAALEAHQTADYVTRYIPRLRELVDSHQVEYFDIVTA